MRNAEAERFVRDVWATFQREGIVGVLTLASEDAQWRPHSAHSRQFRSTAEYRERLEQSALGEERVEGLREVGHADPVLAREAFIALHRDAGLEPSPG